MTDEQRAEELLANDDIPVDVSRPVFSGAAHATLEKVEAKVGEDGQSVSAVLHWLTQDEVSDTNGRSHPPGTRVQDRLNLRPKAETRNARQVAEIAVQTASKIIRAAGKLSGPSLTAGDALKGLKASVGVRQLLRMEADGDFTRIKYAKPA
jgi:hypothetical protein